LSIQRVGNKRHTRRVEEMEAGRYQDTETVDAAGLSLVPAPPRLSIVVPTRDEAANVAPLVAAIRSIPELAGAEVVFVDDSSDETPARVAALAEQDDAIVLIHREPAGRVGGLGGAVVEGIRGSRGEWV
jgi:glycosyltransferase involved in cell wall biosynthesis